MSVSDMKKSIRVLTLLLVLVSVLALQSFAAGPEFRYELTVDGKDTVEVQQGDVITVTLHLYRTDAEESYTMYAMQDEIRYNGEFFQLVPDSALLSSGIQSTDISVQGGLREFYMNFVSFSGGAQWQPKTRVGSFQLKVLADSGVSTLTNEDFLVSLKDGSGSYKCEANTLTVILNSTCTVRYESNGGTAVDPVTAIFGETLTRPQDPVREGKEFAGWYKDLHLTQPWSFETDTVQGNMTLYAKWENKAPVTPVDPTPGPGVDPVPPTPGPEPQPPTPGPGDDPVTPPDPGVDDKPSCVICGRENTPGALPLCAFCLLILVLIFLVLTLVVILLTKRKPKGKE